MQGHDAMQFELTIRPPMQAIDPELIYRQPTLTKALHLCQSLSGFDDAQFYGADGIVKDQAQWSRIMGAAGSANFPQDKLNLFMDKAGNEAPLLWLLHSRHYDITQLRHVETEMERRLRMETERANAAENKVRVLTEVLSGRVAHA
jgi:hypothetical protein